MLVHLYGRVARPPEAYDCVRSRKQVELLEHTRRCRVLLGLDNLGTMEGLVQLRDFGICLKQICKWSVANAVIGDPRGRVYAAVEGSWAAQARTMATKTYSVRVHDTRGTYAIRAAYYSGGCMLTDEPS